jgi:pimeloyl-ACP methyl ester carboxylesterase
MTLRTHLDGAVFAEHVSGYPPRILGLHGWGRDRSDLLPSLAGREVVAVDLPGFGSSPEPDTAWGAESYADAVATVVSELGEGPYLVVGHSFGGRVGASLASRHPELVCGIVFLGVPLLRQTSASKPPLAYRTMRTARRLRLVPESVLDRSRRRYGSADYLAADGRMRAILVRLVNEDYRAELAQIACPVGFCWGSRDSVAPSAIATEAATFVSRVAVLDIVEGAGHDVHRDAPERVSAAIDAVASFAG